MLKVSKVIIDDEKTFREAVEWSDKTMIEKACNFFKCYIVEHFEQYSFDCGGYILCYDTDDERKTPEQIIQEFRKIMENA